MSMVGDLVAILMQNKDLVLALMATIVKLVVDQLQNAGKKIDASGAVDGFKVPVQIMVMVASALVVVGNAALQGHLADLNFDGVVNMVMAYVMVVLGATGVHKLSRDALVSSLGRPTLLKRK